MMFPDLTRRADLVELMDSGGVSEDELERTLTFLEGVNRNLGGYGLVFKRLSRWLSNWPRHRPVTVLDVGTGGGDLPRAIRAWGKRRGLTIRVTGLDSDPVILKLARKRTRSGIEYVQASLREFAERGERFDFVIASLVLHHVPDAELAGALAALDRLARHGVLVSDLRRCAMGWLGASALTALLGNRIVRHDGPVSVRRSFTESELEELALRAGLPYLCVRRHAGFRLSLTGAKHAG